MFYFFNFPSYKEPNGVFVSKRVFFRPLHNENFKNGETNSMKPFIQTYSK